MYCPHPPRLCTPAEELNTLRWAGGLALGWVYNMNAASLFPVIGLASSGLGAGLGLIRCGGCCICECGCDAFLGLWLCWVCLKMPQNILELFVASECDCLSHGLRVDHLTHSQISRFPSRPLTTPVKDMQICCVLCSFMNHCCSFWGLVCTTTAFCVVGCICLHVLCNFCYFATVMSWYLAFQALLSPHLGVGNCESFLKVVIISWCCHTSPVFIGPPGLRTCTCSVTDVMKWIYVVMFVLWRCRVSIQRPTVGPDVVLKPVVYKGGPAASRGGWRVRSTWGQRVTAALSASAPFKLPSLNGSSKSRFGLKSWNRSRFKVTRQVLLKLRFAWKLASSAQGICDLCSCIVVQRCQ